jgi:hypothetical protein
MVKTREPFLTLKGRAFFDPYAERRGGTLE